ncbi:hypothetical protein L202_07419 [Cryptococcus amylolentus CBS 6039]|uniref:Myotubularin phosphatase domain-containing protein n=1 Tax=Cryptococcus amylolentus CBS 6039 TaxID=1295533 RepID=A0A1E3HEQ3_9TREE|nr:hypothetical protein L202_07419 [Cryptococcus amylolentus CBS 6039]ODN73911.1 hypothetical protein L202_07419 [Cryptococcus amylolentus CBS 6039]
MDALRVARVDNVAIEFPELPQDTAARPTHRRITGDLHLTPHHLIFSQSAPSASPHPEIWIPYPNIALLTRLPQTIYGLYPVQIETKTFESYVLLFNKDREGGAEDVWQSVKDCTVKNSVEQLYAFFYVAPSPGKGWQTYNARAEFARQGLGTRTKAWRFTDINKDYSFSPTYPNKLVVPSRISDSTLSYAAKYRSKARIPALTYLHWANNASITRSSQPMVGMKNSRSSQDERLVECIFSSHHFLDNAYSSTSTSIYGATSTNLIIDARPTTNAMANVAMGAGTENMENYKLGKKSYLGIDNIHVMRGSLKIIAEAIREANARPTIPLDRGLLRKSNWLRHISTILDGALIIIRNVHLNASHVLIHCSDGWDRTAQLSAVAQIALDPYYRTFEGFKILVEKDWLSFGHKFLDRSGHLSSEKYFSVTESEDDLEEDGPGGGAQRAAQAFFASVQKQFKSTSHLKEISPVFHQFLECVRQIQRQFPERFEFNEQYLLDTYRHLHSCQFGTFLFNNERERQTSHSGKPYVERTASVWDFIERPSERAKHVNPSYDPSLDKSDVTSGALEPGDQGVLLYDPKDVQFWFRLFGRGDEEMNGLPVSLAAGVTGVDSSSTVTGSEDDPVRVEGIVRGVTPVGAPSTDPLSVHATPLSPEPATSSPGPKSWNWSQISGTAFNAVQSAARDFRTISTDAFAQIKAEADELERNGWGREDDRKRLGSGVTRGSGPVAPSTGLSRMDLRVPSEANPWASESPRSPPVSSPARPDLVPSIPAVAVRPGPSRTTTSNPWATAPTPIPSLSGLSIKDKSTNDAAVQGSVEATERRKENDESWDPLGAL